MSKSFDTIGFKPRRIIFRQVKFKDFCQMMSSDDRDAFVGELELYTYQNFFPNDAPKAQPLFEQIEKMHKSKTLGDFVQGDSTLSLREIDLSEKGFAKLLFWLVNPKIPDSEYANPTTGKKRTATRLSGEEPVRSGHMLVDLRSQHDWRRCYPASIEDVDYIPRSMVINFFGRCFKDHFSKKKKRVLKNDTKTFRPMCKFNAPLSHTLDGVFDNGGVLKGVKWIEEQVVSSTFGDKTYPVFQHKDVQMSVKNKPTAQSAKQMLLDFWNGQKATALKGMKVSIEDEFSNPKTLSIDLKRSNILSNVFLKKSNLHGFSSPLALCEEKVRHDMIDKMKVALKS